MIGQFDKRIETILDALLKKANDANVEILVESAFSEEVDPDKQRLSCITHRPDNNQFGIISVDVKEYPDEPLVLFVFNSDLYTYAKMEGFDAAGMLEGGFTNKVFIKSDIKDFFDHMLQDGE